MQPDGEMEPPQYDSVGVRLEVTVEVLELQRVKVRVPEGVLDTDAEIVRDRVVIGVADVVDVVRNDPVTDTVGEDDPQTETVGVSERLPLPLFVMLPLEESERVGDTETVFDTVSEADGQIVTVDDADRVDDNVGLAEGESVTSASVEEAEKDGKIEQLRETVGVPLTLKLFELDVVVEKVVLEVDEWLILDSNDTVAVAD